MTPNVDERLASVVRALTDVVLPALPPEAGLAQEQVQLSIGQIQILRAQLDGSIAFEAEELADAIALGEQLVAHKANDELNGALANARDAKGPADVRTARVAIHAAIHDVVTSAGGDPALSQLVITAEKRRVAKDRAWFAPFGFDIAPPEA